MNAQSHQGLWDEAFCVEQALLQFALGRQRFFGAEGETTSWFHYRAAAVASLLISAVESTDPSIPDPRMAGSALMRSARIQAVQCAPTDSNRRSPAREMMKRCPNYLLWPMVECLEPTMIAVLGTDARIALEKHFEMELKQIHPLVRVGRVDRPNEATRIVALRHPSSGFGMQSIRAVQELIRAETL